MERVRVLTCRKALAVLLCVANCGVEAQLPENESSPRLPDQSEREFHEYNDELGNLSRRVLNQVRVINDRYMQKLHTAICDKEQAMFTAGLEHQAPVCQRLPPGFDKDHDCPQYVNAIGGLERHVLSPICADLLEEEYFYNLTMTYEHRLKDFQTTVLARLHEESDAVRAEFTTHLQQVEKVGGRSLLAITGDNSSTQKGSGAANGSLLSTGDREARARDGAPHQVASEGNHRQIFGHAQWVQREAEAWRAEMHEESEAMSHEMQKIVSELQQFRQDSLQKVAEDLNRTIGRAVKVNRAMLKAHSQAWDCWGKIDMDVYDFTPWILMHPGGSHLITDKCGTDVTNEWNHFHAAVGDLPGERRVGLWDPDSDMDDSGTTHGPCEQGAAAVEPAGSVAQRPDGSIGRARDGRLEDVPVSLASQRTAGQPVGFRPRGPPSQVPAQAELVQMAQGSGEESETSPVSWEEYRLRVQAAQRTGPELESASLPGVALMRRAEVPEK